MSEVLRLLPSQNTLPGYCLRFGSFSGEECNLSIRSVGQRETQGSKSLQPVRTGEVTNVQNRHCETVPRPPRSRNERTTTPRRGTRGARGRAGLPADSVYANAERFLELHFNGALDRCLSRRLGVGASGPSGLVPVLALERSSRPTPRGQPLCPPTCRRELDIAVSKDRATARDSYPGPRYVTSFV